MEEIVGSVDGTKDSPSLDQNIKKLDLQPSENTLNNEEHGKLNEKVESKEESVEKHVATTETPIECKIYFILFFYRIYFSTPLYYLPCIIFKSCTL